MISSAKKAFIKISGYSLAIAVLSLVNLNIAKANTIDGSLWFVTDATAQNAIPANVPATTPDITFQVNSPLNFNSYSGYTEGQFLATGGAFNIIENTSGALSTVMDASGIGTLLDFSGLVSVTNGQTFTVTHDDGLTLIIDGLNVVNVPGPTPPITTTVTYGGPTGTYAFDLVYGECCGAPAVLQVDLPFTNVPEPSTMLILGSGLIGIFAFRKHLGRAS